jgi:hypothetical protein
MASPPDRFIKQKSRRSDFGFFFTLQNPGPVFLKLFYPDCCRAFGALFHIKADSLTFFKGLETLTLNGRVVNKDIFAVISRDESITLACIEPLHCAFRHFTAPLLMGTVKRLKLLMVRYLGAFKICFRQTKGRFPDNPKISNQTIQCTIA